VDIGEHFPFPVGSFVSSNLTPAGRLKHWSDGEIFRAISQRRRFERALADRHVVHQRWQAGDDDTQALIAYIRSQPATGEQTANPPDQLNLLGAIMLGAGMLPEGKPVFNSVISAPLKGPTVQYGEYIMSYQDCRECHGTNLTGGLSGQLGPIGPDLNLVKEWKLEEFVATMRTGTDPGGHEMSEQMPWRLIGKMNDEELGAVYEYLIHLPGP
jgi:cytochrome c553